MFFCCKRKPPTPAEPLKRPEEYGSSIISGKDLFFLSVIFYKECLQNEGDINGMGDMVRQLKTPLERIEFVSPYERP
uniref:Uncharacterized protein n=1 Tax=Panagrolaimus superbus TaxID=310955 RepID=A0A914YS20_9BILA